MSVKFLVLYKLKSPSLGFGIICPMTAAEVRARSVMLESMRLVAGRRDPDAPSGKLCRVYVATAEGRRKAGVSDARSTTSTV